jgi:hypothetical protein
MGTYEVDVDTKIHEFLAMGLEFLPDDSEWYELLSVKETAVMLTLSRGIPDVDASVSVHDPFRADIEARAIYEGRVRLGGPATIAEIQSSLRLRNTFSWGEEHNAFTVPRFDVEPVVYDLVSRGLLAEYGDTYEIPTPF